MSDPLKEFEQLSSEIKDIEVKKLSWEREKQRLEQEFEEQKKKIKDDYDVELGEFDNAIKALEGEVAQKVEKIKTLLEEFKKKTTE